MSPDRLQPARRLPAVDLRQVQIHQDQIGPLGRRHGDPCGAIPGVENVIPEEAVIKLNVRTFDEGVRQRVLAAIERIVNAVDGTNPKS
jgi:metal-dependent amidase/aminoacylase/carboxypeptidase family protein